jgi:fatty acid/phospholipid biosynthesis enzyme
VLCLPYKGLKVAKRELDSENESALGLRGIDAPLIKGGGGSNPKSMFNLIITSYLTASEKMTKLIIRPTATRSTILQREFRGRH